MVFAAKPIIDTKKIESSQIEVIDIPDTPVRDDSPTGKFIQN